MLNVEIGKYTVEIGDLDWDKVAVDLYIKKNIITVKEQGQVVLCSKFKSKEEFFNYLGFLIDDKKVIQEIEKIYDDPYKYIVQYEYEHSLF